MNGILKTTFYESKAFKATYYPAVLIFLVQCAYRISLLFNYSPGLPLVILSFAGVLLLFYFVQRKICGRGEESEQGFFVISTAFLCTMGFQMYIETGKSVVWLLIFSGWVFFLKRALIHSARRKVSNTSAVLGILFAVAVFLGVQLERYGRLEIVYILDEPISLLRLLLGFAAQLLIYTTVLNYALSYILDNDWQNLKEEKPEKWSPLVHIGIYTFVILLCWLPYYFAFFPGNLSPDSLSELNQQLGNMPLSNHHPYIHQLFIALCLNIGGASLENGVAVYTALQMLLLALSFAACTQFLSSMGAGKGIRIAVLCFFALFPVNAFYSVTMWKDILHAAATLILMMLLLIESRGSGDSKKTKILRCALIVLISFIFCVFRNNGWYAFLLGFPLYILCNRDGWKRLSLVFLAVFLLVSSYNHLIFDVMGIKKSASGEALSIPLQQIARTISQDPNELYSEEGEILREIFPDIEELGNKYASYISDPIKAPDTFESHVFDEDPARYLGCWAKLGIRHPVTYVEAFLLQNYGYWYPDVTYWIVHNTIEENELGLAHREERFSLRHEMSMLVRDVSEQLPSSILFSVGLIAWLMTVAAALLCLKGHGKLASPMLVLAMLWLTVLASPVYCEYVYIYGILVCLPLFLGLSLSVESREKAPKNN